MTIKCTSSLREGMYKRQPYALNTCALFVQTANLVQLVKSFIACQI